MKINDVAEFQILKSTVPLGLLHGSFFFVGRKGAAFYPQLKSWPRKIKICVSSYGILI